MLPIHTLRLGVELDTFEGHHYISSIATDGPIAKLGLLQLEDELLEVQFLNSMLYEKYCIIFNNTVSWNVCLKCIKMSFRIPRFVWKIKSSRVLSFCSYNVSFHWKPTPLYRRYFYEYTKYRMEYWFLLLIPNLHLHTELMISISFSNCFV